MTCSVCGIDARFRLDVADADVEEERVVCGTHLPATIKRLLQRYTHVTVSLV